MSKRHHQPPPQHPLDYCSMPSLLQYINYPLKGIPHPHAHDVLCGRGGQSNTHPGNMQWRTLVAANKELYVSLPKKQKMLLSQSIVNAVRSQTPPGRFLQKDAKNDLWYDVGERRAQEKTSQALREGAPEIRNKLKDKEEADKKEEPSATKATPTASPERNESSEQMPPPPEAPAVLPPSIRAQGPEQTTASPRPVEAYEQDYEPEPMLSQPWQHFERKAEISQQLQRYDQNLAVAPDDSMPPPPSALTEADFSFGSIGLMTDAEQARLLTGTAIDSKPMEYAYQNRSGRVSFTSSSAQVLSNEETVPHPVDGGLEPIGMSFGSFMSTGTVPNSKLERGGLSFGSAMSVSVVNGSGHNRQGSFARAPDLQDIGTSFGSLSLAEGERERIIAAAQRDLQIMKDDDNEAVPTFLQQQKSRGNLLECSDSDPDDEETNAAASAQKSAEWEKLQAALAIQDGRPQSMAPPALYQQQQQQPMFDRLNIPTTSGLHREFSQMSALSVEGDLADFEPIASTERVTLMPYTQHYSTSDASGNYSTHYNNNDPQQYSYSSDPRLAHGAYAPAPTQRGQHHHNHHQEPYYPPTDYAYGVFNAPPPSMKKGQSEDWRDSEQDLEYIGQHQQR